MPPNSPISFGTNGKVYTIDGRDDDKEIKKLFERIKGSLRIATQRGIESTAERIITYIKTEAIPNMARQPFDLGFYAGGFFISVVAPGIVDIVNRTPYAIIIEKGAKSGNIKVGAEMIHNLAMWVKRKGIPLPKVSAGENNEDKAATKLAFAIAEKFKARGIFRGGRGLRIVEKAFKEKLKQFAQEEITHEFELAMKNSNVPSKVKKDPPTAMEKIESKAQSIIGKAQRAIAKDDRSVRAAAKLVKKALAKGGS